MENEEKILRELYGKMAALCSRSEQCTPDVMKKITGLGADPGQAEMIISRLREEKFLDDERYARTYANEKFRINKWGRIKIRYYLKFKGLEEHMIMAGLSEIDQEEYIRLLVKTMKEKAKSIKNAGKYDKAGQVIRFVQSRGFEPELIHRYLEEAVS